LNDGHRPVVFNKHGFDENAEGIPNAIADSHDRKRPEDHVPAPENAIAPVYVQKFSNHPVPRRSGSPLFCAVI